MNPLESADELGARLAGHAPRLRLLMAHLCGRSIRSRVEIEDLVQEVFLRALSTPGELPAGDALPGEAEPAVFRYLAAIARHVVVDAARAIRSQKRGGGSEPRRLDSSSASGLHASSIALKSSGPATRAGRAELGRELVEAFWQLEPDHRRVLGLRQFEGLPAAECARRMGRSEVAIHSLYRRALSAWGVALGGDPPHV
jgi:RNA polymerase sigma factor (sigma-70 family)